MKTTRRLRGSHNKMNLITILSHNGTSVQIRTATGRTAWVSASFIASQTKTT